MALILTLPRIRPFLLGVVLIIGLSGGTALGDCRGICHARSV